MANIMNMVNGKPIEDASVIANAVRYDVEQIRSEEEKAKARQNIGCFCEAGGGGGAGGGGALMVNVSQDGPIITLDKTWQEIYDAAMTGAVVFKQDVSAPTGDNAFYIFYNLVDTGYRPSSEDPGRTEYRVDIVEVGDSSDQLTLTTYSADGYPRFSNLS